MIHIKHQTETCRKYGQMLWWLTPESVIFVTSSCWCINTSSVLVPGRGSLGMVVSQCQASPSSPPALHRRTPSRTWRWCRRHRGPCNGTSTPHCTTCHTSRSMQRNQYSTLHSTLSHRVNLNVSAQHATATKSTLQCQTPQVAQLSLQCQTQQVAQLSLQCQTPQVAQLSLQCQTQQVAQLSLQCQTQQVAQLSQTCSANTKWNDSLFTNKHMSHVNKAAEIKAFFLIPKEWQRSRGNKSFSWGSFPKSGSIAECSLMKLAPDSHSTLTTPHCFKQHSPHSWHV